MQKYEAKAFGRASRELDSTTVPRVWGCKHTANKDFQDPDEPVLTSMILLLVDCFGNMSSCLSTAVITLSLSSSVLQIRSDICVVSCTWSSCFMPIESPEIWCSGMI